MEKVTYNLTSARKNPLTAKLRSIYIALAEIEQIGSYGDRWREAARVSSRGNLDAMPKKDLVKLKKHIVKLRSLVATLEKLVG
jgi:hypothetical protein